MEEIDRPGWLVLAAIAEAEEEYDAKHWFSLTESGSAAWESNAEGYASLKALADRSGWDQGLKVLADSFPWLEGPRLRLDKSSFQHSTIDGFYATYHKYLTGGHRIDFRFSPDKEG